MCAHCTLQSNISKHFDVLDWPNVRFKLQSNIRKHLDCDVLDQPSVHILIKHKRNILIVMFQIYRLCKLQTNIMKHLDCDVLDWPLVFKL